MMVSSGPQLPPRLAGALLRAKGTPPPGPAERDLHQFPFGEKSHRLPVRREEGAFCTLGARDGPGLEAV